MNKTPLLLLILDGFGKHDPVDDNAIYLANTPNYKYLLANYPHTWLDTKGRSVGLPDGQMGNSEVGHMTIGTGRVIMQDLTMIDAAIETKNFIKNETLLQAFDLARAFNKNIHIIGLTSDGGVHSHINHVKALHDLSQHLNAKKIYLHAFLDGRDTPPKSAIQYITQIQQMPNLELASMCGRFYAMDRDQRLERTDSALKLLTNGIGTEISDPIQAINTSYANNIEDEFVLPIKIQGTPNIAPDDIVIFFNFRADRARQLSFALEKYLNNNNNLLTFTNYSKELHASVVFNRQSTDQSLGEIISKHNLKQLRIAETEKFAHVTYFFNGGQNTVFNLEERIIIPSLKVTTYDLAPEMQAYAITNKIIENWKNFDLIICNLANADMVGHCGKLDAAIQAVEVLDACLGKLYQQLIEYGGIMLITADHGNIEDMWDEVHQQPHTRHTFNLVPFIAVTQDKLFAKTTINPTLSDVAPTILHLLDLDIPTEMTGNVLFNKQ